MNILAAFIFFTRLPFWRIKEVPPERFAQVVGYWPLTGWLTGGIMAGVTWLLSFVFPLSAAIIVAIISRILLTGALHEDGLADFMDGFGGGNTREKTLAIMKDSHIGTYGVLGLILYFLLLVSLLSTLPLSLLLIVILAGDIWSKYIASQIANVLPYARKEEDSKSKTVYLRTSWKVLIPMFFCSIIPFVLLPLPLVWAALFPVVTFGCMYVIMNKRLQGYTGDCCGAMFLLCELSFYLGVVLLTNIQLYIS